MYNDDRIRELMNECSDLRVELMKLQEEYSLLSYKHKILKRESSEMEDDYLVLCDILEESDDRNIHVMNIDEFGDWLEAFANKDKLQ